jgi:hypothetical protein
MSYLDQLEAMQFKNALPLPTAITAKSPYDSKDSTQGRQVSESKHDQETVGENKNTPTQAAALTAFTPYGSKDNTQGRQFSRTHPAEPGASWRPPGRDFYNHLMGCSRCYALRRRYCPMGLRLRDVYRKAVDTHGR